MSRMQGGRRTETLTMPPVSPEFAFQHHLNSSSTSFAEPRGVQQQNIRQNASKVACARLWLLRVLGQAHQNQLSCE